MSEFLAEAEVLIRPNTAGFRTTLIAELTKATKGIVVPIPVVAQATGAKTAVAANKAAAASATQATAATNQLQTARTRQAVADREAATAEANLAQAQRLTAAAQARVTAIETAGARATSELAAARAQLRAANVAVVAGERAVDAAMLAGADAAQADAVETLRLAIAQRALAVAAEEAAAATVVGARAAAGATRSHAQLTRGIEAETLALGGIRGATLAASSGFLIGAAAVTVLAKSVHEASREQEAAARVQKVFGADAKTLERNARDLADAFGLSAAEALKFEGQMGNILHSAGLANTELAGLSETLVKRAADISAFANVPLDLVLKAISQGLAGNSRALKQFGADLTAARVNDEALAESGKKTTDELTRRERTQARITLILRDTTNAEGAAARRSGDLAQQTRVLNANLSNLGADLGKVLIPALGTLVGDINDTIHGFERLAQFAKSLAPPTEDSGHKMTAFGQALHFLHGSVSLSLRLAPAFLKFLSQTSTEADKAANSINNLKGGFLGIPGLLGPATGAMNLFKLATQQAQDALSGLQEHQLDLTFTGASSAAKIANLQAQIRKDQEIIRHPGAGGAAARQRARQDRNAAQAEINSIRAEDAANAQAAVDAVKSAAAQAASLAAQRAQEAQQQLDDQDQQLLFEQQIAQGRVEIAKTKALGTTSLVDDLAALRLELRITNAQIVEASKIHDANLRLQTIQGLTLKSIQTQQAIAATEEAQRQARAAHRNLVRDRKEQRLDLDIEIADTNKTTAEQSKNAAATKRAINAEIAARQAKIRFDQEQLKSVHGDIVRKKQLQLDIARQRQTIAELTRETEKKNDATAELAFAFLQAQQGFAANVLSNLLPTTAVAGTVGGTANAISTPTVVGPAGFATAVHQRGTGGGPSRPPDVGGGVARAAQAQATRGATAGQLSALIAVNRQMLQVLMTLAGRTAHPEAHTQRVMSEHAMDYLNA